MKTFVWLLQAALLAFGVRAIAAETGYKDLKIQDLLGASWPEFAAELDSLLVNPRNEDAFYRMYKIAQRSDAESKVPQFLLKLNREHPEKRQIQTLLGLFYRENRDYAQAANYFRNALKSNPDDYFVHYQLAHLLSKQDGAAALNEALEHYRLAADRIGSSDLDLKSRLLEEWGQLLIDRSGGDAKAREIAAQVWDRLIADERRFDKATYERLAQIYQRTQMWEKAIATYRLFLTNAGGDDPSARARVLDEIGGLAEQMSDFASACSAYAEALSLVDENHWLHKQLVVKLITAHKKAGNDAAFLAALRKTASDRPHTTAPLRDLALAFESLGDNASAIQALEQATALAPRDVTLISNLLLLYSKAGPTALAKKAELYGKLAAIMPENFDAYAGLADTYWEMGDSAKIQEALSMLQNTASTLPEKYRVMAGAYRKFGMKANARNAYERALAGAGSGSDTALEFCDFCLSCAETEGSGGDSLQRALDLRNALMAQGTLDESGYLRLLDVFRSHKRDDEARDIIGYAATNVFPKSFVCRNALAELHYSRKEFGKAIQHYVAALELAPSYYFKRLVNDRITTLSWNYGRRAKDFLSEPTAEEKNNQLVGGANGEGLAPWIYYLQARIGSDPQNPDTMMLLAQINENTMVDAKVGEVPVKTGAARAKALYKSVVDMDLKNLDAHAALARTLVATDEFEGAIQENWILEELSPVGKWQYVMNAGDLWALAGYKDKAIQNWNTVSAQATSEPNLVFQLGCRMFQAGKLDEAIALVRKAAAANRTEFRFHAMLGNLLELSSAGAGEEAVQEFKTAVGLAEQNSALSSKLQTVLRRLLAADVRLARARFDNRKYSDCLLACAEAHVVLEKVNDSMRPQIAADLDVLRARALLAGDEKKAGEELLRATVKAQPATRFWIDDAFQVTGNHLLTLFNANELPLSKQVLLPPKSTAGFSMLSVGLSTVPGTIGTVQKSSGNAVFIDCAGTPYNSSVPPAALQLHKLKAAGFGAPLMWLHDDVAAKIDTSELTLIDLRREAVLWKKNFVPSALFSSGAFVALFHSDPQSKSNGMGLMLIDRDSGRELWDVDSPAGQIVFSEKFLLVRSDVELVALHLESGAVAWRVPVSRNGFWRRPVVIGSTVLSIDDMTRELLAYDLGNGELKFQRALRATLLSDPVSEGPNRAIIHFLDKRVVTLECIDTVTGQIVWENRLENEANENLGGIGIDPVSWNGWLLHLDGLRHRIWAVQMKNGGAAPPLDLKNICDPRMFGDVTSWGIVGDVLYIAARSGHIAWIKLAN